MCDRRKRALVLALPILAAAGWVGVSGCAGKSIGTDAGGASSTPADPTVPSSGGGATAGAPGISGGTSANTGEPGIGGATATSGGSSGIGAQAGSATTVIPSGPGVFCNSLITQGGLAPTKGAACVPTDPQFCYKTCGPQSTGFKSETCTAGVYVEQAGCSFPPDLDATCYKIPPAIDPSCPIAPPQASTPCVVAACTVCNADGTYLDSTGAPKLGYCICPAPGASGISKWSCAVVASWPCPGGKGC